jgi:hypothetical protein
MEEKIITQCCVCGQIQKNGEYDGIKREIIRNRLDISHGYCPKCFKIEMEKIEKL